MGVDLPEIFDTAYIRANPVGDRVALESLERIIHLANLAPRTVEEVKKKRHTHLRIPIILTDLFLLITTARS